MHCNHKTCTITCQTTVNPRMALVWETFYNLTSKLMYGTAFRAPSFSEMYAINNPVTLGNPKLRPETMDTVELAFDYRPRYDLRLGWNIFNYWWKDLIRYVPDANGGSSTAQNTGSQAGYGTELEAEWKATDTLKLIGNYAFQKSRDQTLNHDAGNSLPIIKFIYVLTGIFCPIGSFLLKPNGSSTVIG